MVGLVVYMREGSLLRECWLVISCGKPFAAEGFGVKAVI